MRLAVCSSKGGVGKTSTAANLAAVLAQQGRVLAVDADPQDSLGRAFGVEAAREVIAALEGTDLPVLATRIPLSRRVPSSTLAKRPVVLSAPASPVAAAYAALTDDVLTAYRELP